MKINDSVPPFLKKPLLYQPPPIYGKNRTPPRPPLPYPLPLSPPFLIKILKTQLPLYTGKGSNYAIRGAKSSTCLCIYDLLVDTSH